MTRAQLPMFGTRRSVWDAIEDAAVAIEEHAAAHPHWAVAWSGGKDSTALVTLVAHLIEVGRLPRPESLTVLYADTRLELLPLAVSAAVIGDQLQARGIDVRTVRAPLEKRFLPYILGRGVPPPNNNTLRWCTRQIKADPMSAEMARLRPGSRMLVLTGVRQGESAVRDQRISLSCSRDGGECGQGWYQQDLAEDGHDTLAPLLTWRVCHVWEWLQLLAPTRKYGRWNTTLLSEVYGGDDAEEVNARTGCTGCPLAAHDTALDALLRRPEWAYLAPLKGLRPLWRELREPQHRLRQPPGETRKDGSLVGNQNRMGPITLEARAMALDRVLGIQDAVNEAADREGRPRIDLLDADELALIRRLQEEETYPNRWTGDMPNAALPFEASFADGTVQPLLPGIR